MSHSSYSQNNPINSQQQYIPQSQPIYYTNPYPMPPPPPPTRHPPQQHTFTHYEQPHASFHRIQQIPPPPPIRTATVISSVPPPSYPGPPPPPPPPKRMINTNNKEAVSTAIQNPLQFICSNDVIHSKWLRRLNLNKEGTGIPGIFTLGDCLWYKPNEIFYKIKAKTMEEFMDFIGKQSLETRRKWKDCLGPFDGDSDTLQHIQIKWKGKVMNKTPPSILQFINALRIYDKQKVGKQRKRRLEESVNGMDDDNTIPPPAKKRKLNGVHDWNYYAVIFWLNRVNEGKLAYIEYLNIRKYIFIGKIRGNELYKMNDVILRMIGINDKKQNDQILNAIQDLLENDNFTNIVADTIETEDVPYPYCDPITYEIMQDPVILRVSGNTHERLVIEAYINRFHKDPVTQKMASLQDLIPNKELKEKIDVWKQENFNLP